jgi:CDP-diacylglycerol--glycerol-3-phosphate 3-phosphatidyltransferase
MAILIIGREFAVSGLRSIAAAEGYTIRASDLGKTKMVSQVVAISVMLLSIRHHSLARAGIVLMWGVVFFSVTSAFSYFGKFWHKVDEGVKNRRRRELLLLEQKEQRSRRRQRRRQRGGAVGAVAGGVVAPGSAGVDAGLAGAEGGLAGTIWKPPEVN